jgi:hypothetical protein
VSRTERSRRDEEGQHPEVDRSYDRERGGQLPDEQHENQDDEGPDPEADSAGHGDDEDQGI